jgi:hypothetical protein
MPCILRYIIGRRIWEDRRGRLEGDRLRIADCGLGIWDCGFGIADCGLRIEDWGTEVKRVKSETERAVGGGHYPPGGSVSSCVRAGPCRSV